MPAVAAPTGSPAPARGDRARSDGLLRAARLALAVTDVRRAGDMVRQARQEQIGYAPNEDSPERVDAAIAKFQEVSRLDRGSEDNRKAYARMLMEQSDALLQWGAYAEADQLAALAAQQAATYGPFEAKPEDLLKKIAALRQQNNPAGPRVLGNEHSADGMGPSAAARQSAVEWMRQARAALAAGQIDQATAICRQIDDLRIPESAFGPNEDRPGLVFQDVRQAIRNRASGVIPAGGAVDANQPVNPAVYNPSQDGTRIMQAAAEQPSEPIPAPPGSPGAPPGANTQSPGYGLFQQGEAALKARDHDRALQLFQQAAPYMNEMDQVTAARLQDHLSLLSAPKNPGAHSGGSSANSPVDETMARQQALVREVVNDVGHREADARAMREKDPKMALTMLQETKKKVEAAVTFSNPPPWPSGPALSAPQPFCAART